MRTFQSDEGGPLEDRLRNLILTNHSEGLARSNESDSPSQPFISPETRDSAVIQQPISSKGLKKRPNQAQRRQMSAQLAIPIDPRAHASQPTRLQNNPGLRQHANQNPRRQDTHQNAYHRSQQVMYQNGPHNRDRHASMPRNQRQPQHQGSLERFLHSQGHFDWRRHQGSNFDGFSDHNRMVAIDTFPPRHRQPQSTLYNPRDYRQSDFSPEQLCNQIEILERLSQAALKDAEIDLSEIAQKENFRINVEALCRHAIVQHEITDQGSRTFEPQSVQLKCFGSLMSGFATKAADMDLGLLSPLSRMRPDALESPIPRLIEGALLTAGLGARLLTKTRVPIIKLCQTPDKKLLQGLLEEREKWEKGMGEEDREITHAGANDQDITLDVEAPLSPIAITLLEDSQQETENVMDSLTNTTYEEKLASLKQSKDQTLVAYHGNAKRLLRRVNGRDVTQSTRSTFTRDDWKLLDDVACAFVSGLYDDVLRSRVQSYPSFRAGVWPQDPLDTNCRTLHGAFILVEGERLVMQWESRDPVSSQTDHQSAGSVAYWKGLQHQKCFGVDPLRFARDLHGAIERLRRIPYLQLLYLRQDQYETPSDYHARLIKLVSDLRGGLPSTCTTDLVPRLVEYYVSGIRGDKMKEDVGNFAVHNEVNDLQNITRKHQSIHLAASYERAIDKALYAEEDLPAIREYVYILGGDLVRQTSQTTGKTEFVVPLAPDKVCLLEKIKELPNPQRLAPNQPRDRYHDRLEFPKNGIGVQCDINFAADLALHNTQLLRCYSYTDQRVRPLVLFVKHWAKARGINTPYRGTLSSYGYVLMVLHYLVNIVEPFICPNLQQLALPDPDLPYEALDGITMCQGRNIRFWKDEQEIQRLAHEGRLNQNSESLGSLLRGFFEFYAQNGMMSTVPKRGFDWGRDVLSLRTHGGLLSKAEKGWTGAKTVWQPQSGVVQYPSRSEVPVYQDSPAGTEAGHDHVMEVQSEQRISVDGAKSPPTGDAGKPKDFKEVRHRYLFAIEDPFELDHNVARTVTHNGIVAIRDEFRRAWRIIKSAGKTGQPMEDFLEDVKVHNERVEKKQFVELLEEIHGPGTVSTPVRG